jgi:hypothetical protein
MLHLDKGADKGVFAIKDPLMWWLNLRKTRSDQEVDAPI